MDRSNYLLKISKGTLFFVLFFVTFVTPFTLKALETDTPLSPVPLTEEPTTTSPDASDPVNPTKSPSGAPAETTETPLEAGTETNATSPEPATAIDEVSSEPTPPAEEESPIEPESEPLPTEAPEEDYSADYTLYQKYLRFQKYEQRALYQKYERYAKVAGRAALFENRKQEKKYLKSLAKKYKKYAKSPTKYSQYAPQTKEYLSYGSDKAEYFATKSFASYRQLERFNRPEYNAYKDFGGSDYRSGYERYLALMVAGKASDRGDADLGGGLLGPTITVGLYSILPKDLRDTAFKIEANGAFRIIHRNGDTIAEIPANKSIRVKYVGDKRFRIYDPETDVTIDDTSKEIRFESILDTTVFDVNRPNSSFDRYRGHIRLRYYDSPESDGDRVYIINALPIEHYVWGMGEITGTGPDEYDKVMTTIFRTYGYWKLKWSTKYADQGFKVDATPGNQLYHGYDWEVAHPDIRKGAEATRGTLVMYDREIALTPYSSWTDGTTRRFEDGHWGRNCKTPTGTASLLYPWLSSVTDSTGKHANESTCSLASRGNHMVGLSANGAVRLARDTSVTWQDILNRYYAGVDLITGY